MILSQPVELRESNGRYVVTLPREAVEAMGLHKGDFLFVEVRPVEIRPVMAPAVRDALEASLAENAALFAALDSE